MSFQANNFDDPTKWSIFGTGTVQATANSFQATVGASIIEAAGLISTAQNLANADISIMATRNSGKASLAISDATNPALGIALQRDIYYGILVWLGGDAPLIMADPLPGDTAAEMRIVTSNGTVTIYYNGAQIYSAAIPGWVSTTNVYIYASNEIADGSLIAGTNIFSITGAPPPPPALTVTVIPSSAALTVGGSAVTFTATASGGTAPYNYEWFDSVSGNQLATGNSYVFTPTVEGTFAIRARAIDNIGASADSADVIIQVSPGQAPQYTLNVSAQDSSGNSLVGVPFTLTKVG